MNSKIYAISRLSLALIFFYHGLVPKLMFGNEQEILMNLVMMPFVPERVALISSGVVEVILGVLFIVLYRNLILNYVVMLFAVSVSVAILIFLPELYQNAFNPFSINLSVVALGWINILSSRNT